MNATRLPGKPLAMIGREPMIVHVWRRAMEADIGEVAVACGDKEIAEAITKTGGRAVMTDPNLPSGSDRIWQALMQLDPQAKHDVIVNIQGDMPTLDPLIIKQAVTLLDNPGVDIGTLAAVITDEREKKDPAVVKVVGQTGRAFISPAPSSRPETVRFIIILVYMPINAALYKNLSPCRQVCLKNGKN